MGANDLIECVFATWSPVIGDPTFTGWVTVAAYVIAAYLAAGVFRVQSGRQRIFWLGLSICLLLLAINKQLDLQSALTAAGRCLAKTQGWYEERHAIQIKFILAIIAANTVVAASLAWAMRREFTFIWPALLGLVGLLAFIAIRAAGFHHFDQFIGFEIGGMRMNGILELGGIALIAANALHLLLLNRRMEDR